MSAFGYQGPAGNGTGVEPVRKRTARKRRATAQMEIAAALPVPEAAGFARIEARLVDAPMWPVQPVLWLEPELQPGEAGASGLHIERRHRVPAPGFALPGLAPVGPLPAPERSCAPLAPNARPSIPQSDLALLGWDPRAVAVAGGER